MEWVFRSSLAIPLKTGVFGALLLLAEFLFAASAELIPSAECGWPQFRGPLRDGISSERNLLSHWPEGGPRLLWSVTNLGQGFSSPVISSERIFITGDVGDDLVLHSFDLNGTPGWKATNGAAWKTPYPGARASATISAGRVYHENAHGRVTCLDANTGRELWNLNALERFGGSNITWGLSECLLVDERAVYVTAGGREASVAALNKTNGAVLWKAPPLHESAGERELESASYVSPILVRFGSRRLLIGCTLRQLYCVDADTGALQWTQPARTAYSVLALTPVLIGDAVFMTAPHGKGGRLYRLHENGERVDAKEVWTTTLDTCQGGAVLAGGRLYGSFYSGRKGWAAVNARDGSIAHQLLDAVKGAPLYAEGRIYALCEDGWMLLLEPAEKEFKVRGKFRLADARNREAWAHPVILGKRLYLRYHDRMSCYDIAAVSK